MRNTLAQRPARLGIAGPVGTGKTSVISSLCSALSSHMSVAVVTNDIYTTEDADMLKASGVLNPERIVAVETGACPHTAIRDDVSANLTAVEELSEKFTDLDLVLVESGGDNLTATFSPALVDAQLFVLDVAGGGDVVRKGGPGIARADVLVVNKIDLAPHVRVDAALMVKQGRKARNGLPVMPLSRHDAQSIAQLARWVTDFVHQFSDQRWSATDPGPMAPHSHSHEHAN